MWPAKDQIVMGIYHTHSAGLRQRKTAPGTAVHGTNQGADMHGSLGQNARLAYPISMLRTIVRRTPQLQSIVPWLDTGNLGYLGQAFNRGGRKPPPSSPSEPLPPFLRLVIPRPPKKQRKTRIVLGY